MINFDMAPIHYCPKSFTHKGKDENSYLLNEYFYYYIKQKKC